MMIGKHCTSVRQGPNLGDWSTLGGCEAVARVLQLDKAMGLRHMSSNIVVIDGIGKRIITSHESLYVHSYPHDPNRPQRQVIMTPNHEMKQ